MADYDDLPDSIRQGAAEADEQIRALTQPPQPPQTTQETPPQPAPQAPPVPQPPQTEDFEQKYRSLQGKYNAEIRDAVTARQNAEREVQQLRDMVAQIQRQPEPQNNAPSRPPVTPEVTSKLPRHIVDAVNEEFDGTSAQGLIRILEMLIAPIAAQLQDLNSRTTGIDDVKKNVDTVRQSVQDTRLGEIRRALDQLSPNWRQVDVDPVFEHWLRQSDPDTGIRRLTIFTTARDEQSYERLARMYNQFASEHGYKAPQAPATPKPTLDSFAAPSPGQQGSGAPEPVDDTVWTALQFDQALSNLYAARESGQLTEEQFNQNYRVLNRALQEGRVR